MFKFKSKKGSHVGVVLSFILFITFVLFMYILLNSRVNQQTGKSSALEYVKGEITERVSQQMRIISVKVESGSSCIELSNFLSEAGITNKLVAVDDSGNTLNVGISGQSVQVQKNTNTFFRVYASDEFPAVSGSISCQAGSHTTGLSKAEDFVFESKVASLLSNYSSDYESLKTDLKIGSRDEFGFIFTYNNGTMLSTPLRNISVDVYASQTPVQYIKTSGTKEAGMLTVLVW